VHISLAPTWFDPAETPGVITPFMVMYALHDAVVKPMPDHPLSPAWPIRSVSEDALTYEFVPERASSSKRDPVTAEDVNSPSSAIAVPPTA
jgi:peptide/nickel transport system substrate-binding protein